MSSKGSMFTFLPRPEAKALQWHELLPPVRSAVRDLLVMLHGAERLSGEHDLEVDSCFLVNGERGTGKTSVLLNAKKAVETVEQSDTDNHKTKPKQEEGFFAKNDSTTSDKREEAIKCATFLKNRVVWLDLLDLEPVQPETNLLTTVLVRIRHALDQPGSEGQDRDITSIFEASEDSARPLLDQLIHDATLMWEKIKEQDTRSIASRQMEAAGIYAEFRGKFCKAMDQLSKELGRPLGYDRRRSIILPIDNIDRSTEHLHNIVKLAQLVSHPRLWLVMAGGREDIETFLERAYWKELIRTGEGSEGIGRVESSGEDESLAMARRQAAAAAQKIWPSSHRIVVGLMRPADTLDYYPLGKKEYQIRRILALVRVPVWLQKKDSDKPMSFPLLDWFEYPWFGVTNIRKGDKVIAKIQNQKSAEHPLTEIAKSGLKLPARSVLELWQLAYWALEDKTFFKDKPDQQAEQIARTMLRNTILESKLSCRLSSPLQNEVIRKEVNGGTLLNFKRINLKVECLAPTDTEMPIKINPPKEVRNPVQSRIRAKRGEESFLRFKLRDEKGYEEELPEPVAAWLAVLYDVLALAERLAILNATTIQPPLMVTRHAVVIAEAETGTWHVEEQEIRWPTPHWVTFRAHGLFWRNWKDFQAGLDRAMENHNPAESFANLMPRLLAVGWIDCVLRTFKEMHEQKAEESTGQQQGQGQHECTLQVLADGIENREKEILSKAAKWFDDLEESRLKPPRLRKHFDSHAMRDWLVKDLPLFFSYWYVPVGNGASTRFSDAINYLQDAKTGAEKAAKDTKQKENDNALAQAWKENVAFILAAMDDKVGKLFEPASDAKDADRERVRKIHRKYVETLNGLCEVRRYFFRAMVDDGKQGDPEGAKDA